MQCSLCCIEGAVIIVEECLSKRRMYVVLAISHLLAVGATEPQNNRDLSDSLD